MDKKYLWTAYFDDGKIMAEENGDSLEEMNKHRGEAKLLYIDLNDRSFAYGFDFGTQRFGVEGTWFSLSHDVQTFKDFVPVVEREGDIYMIGFEAKRENGESVRQVIYVS